jgi:hypothetical protein
MTERVSLTLTGEQHEELRKHLFPGDGLEAVAFLICGRARGHDRHRLLVRYLHPIPYENCIRGPDFVRWSAEDIEPLLERAEVDGLSLVKVHSHPGGLPRFSSVDDESDADLLPTIRSWVAGDIPHCSAIMLPNGVLFGRYIWRDDMPRDLELISVIGPNLNFWRAGEVDKGSSLNFGASQDQAFGEGTTRQLQGLRIGVVGISGTGSPTVEQLVRLGAGEVVIVDNDVVKARNLNRITFATNEHAKDETLKVTACAEEVERKGLGTKITPIGTEIDDPIALRALSLCDVIFGCVDTVGGRFTANLLSTHYLIAYFDIGILLEAVKDGDERGKIRDVLGTVNYLIPGRSSLISRECFSLEDVKAEALHKRDPVAAAQQVEDKYIKGMQVSRPAVISVNMFASSLAVNDFLARLHPYRTKSNSDIASIEFSLSELRLTADEEWDDCPIMKRLIGYGDRKLWLGLPELGPT